MAKERTELQLLFVAVVWVAAGTLRVCRVGRMLCNNRAFSCLHHYSIFDHCSSSSLSPAPPGLILINLPSQIQATLPVLLHFLRWNCPTLGDGQLRCLGHEVSPHPSCFPAAFLGKTQVDLLWRTGLFNAEMSGITKGWLSHLIFALLSEPVAHLFSVWMSLEPICAVQSPLSHSDYGELPLSLI